MERAIAVPGGPAGEIEAGLHFPHRAPEPRAPALPLSRQTPGGTSRRSPVTPQPPETPAAGDDPAAGWVRRIQAGVDVERNFEQLYNYFHPRLFAFFHRQRLPPEECEELAQDALFSAFHKIATFEHRSRFSTWLGEIARNQYLNELRRRTSAKRDGVELPIAESLTSQDERTGVVLAATDPNPYEEAERKEQHAALREALVSLPPKMRRCAELRFLHNLKYREIATLMLLNLDTVKAHLGHAKQVLHEKLGPGAGRFTRLGREDEP
jgi:RNA polymerase sigma factor (sigma-70 family)